MQEQESSNMGELVKTAEKTSKNPAVSSVVANTIALMKRQKKTLDGPFTGLFKTLHSEEMIQSKDVEDSITFFPKKESIKDDLEKAKEEASKISHEL